MLELLVEAEVHAPQALGVRHLLVAGGRVVWLGEREPELPAQLGVRRRSLAGKRLIPGLIDCHAHLTGGGGEAGFASRVPPLFARDFLRNGVTAAVGLLGTDDLVRSTAELVASVRSMREQGLSAWCYTGGYHLPPTTLTGSVRGDIVHLDAVLGVGELALSDHRSSQPTLAELLRVASEAHVAGLMSGKAGVVHLHLGDGPRGLELVRRALEESELPARTFQPTHVNRRKALFEEACALAEYGVSIDVTAFPVEEGEDAWSAAEALGRYLDAGLPPERITVSSDGGGCLPRFDAAGRVATWDVGRPAALAATLRELLERGRPLAEVLPAFTSNVADVLCLTDKGRIAPGLDADLATLDAQGRVVDVMAGGRWHLLDGAPTTRGPFEPPV